MHSPPVDIHLPSELTGHCVLYINVNKCNLMCDTCSLLVCVLILFEESDIAGWVLEDE